MKSSTLLRILCIGFLVHLGVTARLSLVGTTNNNRVLKQASGSASASLDESDSKSSHSPNNIHNNKNKSPPSSNLIIRKRRFPLSNLNPEDDPTRGMGPESIDEFEEFNRNSELTDPKALRIAFYELRSRQRMSQRRLPGYEISSEEAFALGAAFLFLAIILCLLCCCCRMCCGGGGGGGCLTDILALFCCYELFCDNQPGCFVPMVDGEMC